jgi:hypothetical protein
VRKILDTTNAKVTRFAGFDRSLHLDATTLPWIRRLLRGAKEGFPSLSLAA